MLLSVDYERQKLQIKVNVSCTRRTVEEIAAHRKTFSIIIPTPSSPPLLITCTHPCTHRGSVFSPGGLPKMKGEVLNGKEGWDDLAAGPLSHLFFLLTFKVTTWWLQILARSCSKSDFNTNLVSVVFQNKKLFFFKSLLVWKEKNKGFKEQL